MGRDSGDDRCVGVCGEGEEDSGEHEWLSSEESVCIWDAQRDTVANSAQSGG